MSMITEVTSVSSKGQVVLPKNIRDALSLDTGSKLIVVTDGDNILLKPIVAPNLSEFDELMKESQKWAKEVGMTESDIDEAITAVRKRRKS
ncbi:MULTISPECIES: AbrB/MazE/SpoVT family DNA-binding domain-containing protein [unclassified Butyrivibrio]|uniref:AbrB/MazE/SpoVT family DNA-binding domain-containing protein n=1 Tax=unclassified Butyrivibrio TaxID=2639466 RepID=UPI0008BECCEA|nr:AbrB/MazE/SpoVT family DNA-binding domain-containing protein [Butyrivibrio sp. ob235]SEL15929.1 looped-hinge helix DNA binding domain-containing protein, AbrB family [Butyrivibrio sp. ob235]